MPHVHVRSIAGIGLACMALLLGACTPTVTGSSGEPVVNPPATSGTSVPPGGTTFQQSGPIQSLGGCQLHPRNHFLNATNINTLPKHARSDAWLAPLDDGAKLLPPRGALSMDGNRRGMPFNIVDSRVIGKEPVSINLASARAFRGEYPMPYSPVVQGAPGWHADRHVLLLDQADCTAYELIGYEPLSKPLLGIHTALNGAMYRLDTTAMPFVTTNAPKTPLFGQYATVAEANADAINHPIGWCSDIIGTESVWPSRQSDGKQSADAIPMGAWVRLKRDVDPNKFTGQARAIVNGLKRHGAVLTDTCGHRMAIMAEASPNWNDRQMDELRVLDAGNFEVVDTRPMMVNPSTYEIR